MFSVVVPAKNEGEHLEKVLDNCRDLPINKIIVVLNGCTDNSREVIETHFLREYVHIVEYRESLGIDIPRAIGALYAYKNQAAGVLFLDGDMQGDITLHLQQLITAITVDNMDMALTNCYPYITPRPAVANKVLYYREKLNRTLGVFAQLGLANPSHGPHAVSHKLLETVPWPAIAIPPLSLAIAVRSNLKVGVVTSVSHNLLLSPLRNDDHSIFIAETIIGDCLEALCYLKGIPPTREDKGIYYLGYHPYRKFQSLEEYAQELGLI